MHVQEHWIKLLLFDSCLTHIRSTGVPHLTEFFLGTPRFIFFLCFSYGSSDYQTCIFSFSREWRKEKGKITSISPADLKTLNHKCQNQVECFCHWTSNPLKLNMYLTMCGIMYILGFFYIQHYMTIKIATLDLRVDGTNKILPRLVWSWGQIFLSALEQWLVWCSQQTGSCFNLEIFCNQQEQTTPAS